jgi:Arsenite efflux pump ACR3 and related permeases
MLAGIVTRILLRKKKYFSRVLEVLGSVQTIALLLTIVVIFWGEGYGIVDTPSLVWMVGIVMLIFYFVLFHSGYLTSRKLGHDYQDSTAIGFTVSARDFEVSIAIAVSAFAAYPYVAITTAIGPLLEIPLMLLLVWIQLGREQVMSASKTFGLTEVSKMSNEVKYCEIRKIENVDVEGYEEISRVLNVLGNRQELPYLLL